MALKLSPSRPLCPRPATVALTSTQLLLCATVVAAHLQERVGGAGACSNGAQAGLRQRGEGYLRSG